jgi:hypothetical protein
MPLVICFNPSKPMMIPNGIALERLSAWQYSGHQDCAIVSRQYPEGGLLMPNTSTLRLVLGTVLAMLTAAPAFAQAIPQTRIERLPPGSYLSTQSIPGTECMCRGNGTFYNEGERTCLRTATGRRLALCNKVLNVLNWEISENPCPDT